MGNESTFLQRARQFLRSRRMAYRTTFADRDGEAVLRDLAKFCRANTSAFDPDPQKAALLEGRREVWLRIQQHLKLDDEDLWRLYDGR